jgi:hypothetical protein
MSEQSPANRRVKTGRERPTSTAEIIGRLLPAVPPRGTRPAGYNADVANALVPLTSPADADHLERRVRREVNRWLERTIERAVWRAERRTRRLPWHVGRGIEWVMAQRRTIAYDVFRALLQHGAGDALSRRLAELAAMRFPRDGVVIDDGVRRPRLEGTNPRALGDNPRANGSNPRARRARALPPSDASDAAAMASLSVGRD